MYIIVVSRLNDIGIGILTFEDTQMYKEKVIKINLVMSLTEQKYLHLRNSCIRKNCLEKGLPVDDQFTYVYRRIGKKPEIRKHTAIDYFIFKMQILNNTSPFSATDEELKLFFERDPKLKAYLFEKNLISRRKGNRFSTRVYKD